MSTLIPSTDSSFINYPRISIITPSYNQGKFIEETINSIITQGYPNLEYIIIDGGSHDSTVDIIKKYEKQINYWVSEPDHGQADAINKGLSRCSGEIFGWINSDDMLLPGALFKIAQAYQNTPEAIICGDVINFHENSTGEMLIVQKNISFKSLMAIPFSDTSWHQPGIFIPLKWIKQVGLLDESFRYSFDEDLLLRILRVTGVHYLKVPVAKFRLHQQSKTVAEFDLFLPEVNEVVLKHVNFLPPRERPYILACLELFHARTWLMVEYFDQQKSRKHLLSAFQKWWPIFFSLLYQKMWVKSLISKSLFLKWKKLQIGN